MTDTMCSVPACCEPAAAAFSAGALPSTAVVASAGACQGRWPVRCFVHSTQIITKKAMRIKMDKAPQMTATARQAREARQSGFRYRRRQPRVARALGGGGSGGHPNKSYASVGRACRHRRRNSTQTPKWGHPRRVAGPPRPSAAKFTSFRALTRCVIVVLAVGAEHHDGAQLVQGSGALTLGDGLQSDKSMPHKQY